MLVLEQERNTLSFMFEKQLFVSQDLKTLGPGVYKVPGM